MNPCDCPLCAGPARRRFAKHGHAIRDCERCGHRFAEIVIADDHVERTYGDGYFVGGGAGYAGYLAEGPILRRQGQWYARLLASFMEPGSVLDVGCAAGFWLRGLVDRGWSGRGVESNDVMAEHARSVLRLPVETAALESLASDERFDLVSMIQIVAHFADVRRALAAAVARIRPGGFLLIETWNRESRTARLLGTRWHEYSPPSVLHWFTPDSVSRLGEDFGLRAVARGRPRKRIGAGHAKSLLHYNYGGSAPGRLLVRALGAVPEGLSIPYLADDLFWLLLRSGGPDPDASPSL